MVGRKAQLDRIVHAALASVAAMDEREVRFRSHERMDRDGLIRRLHLNETNGEPFLTIDRQHYEHPRRSRLRSGDVVLVSTVDRRREPWRVRVRRSDGYSEIWIDLGT